MPREVTSADGDSRSDPPEELATVCCFGLWMRNAAGAAEDLDLARWNKVADFLRANKGGLGDLGGGNHFLDAIVPYSDGPIHFLIHTGSRKESGHVDNLIDVADSFDKEFDRVVRWAAHNRAAIHEKLELVFGMTELLLDLPHNTYEQLADGGVIIRKGSVRLLPGELSVLPSHMSGRWCAGKGQRQSSKHSQIQ